MDRPTSPATVEPRRAMPADAATRVENRAKTIDTGDQPSRQSRGCGSHGRCNHGNPNKTGRLTDSCSEPPFKAPSNDGLAACFNHTRSNEQSFLTILWIAHPAGVGCEVSGLIQNLFRQVRMSVGVFSGNLAQARNERLRTPDLMEFALTQLYTPTGDPYLERWFRSP